jgi:hypothetical protein
MRFQVEWMIEVDAKTPAQAAARALKQRPVIVTVWPQTGGSLIRSEAMTNRSTRESTRHVRGLAIMRRR